MNSDLPHTFVFSPPDHATRPWTTGDLGDFGERLDRAFPGATVQPEGAWDLNQGRVTLSFELPLGDEWLDGLITSPSPGVGSLSVRHATSTEAAEVLAWFRAQYVPPGTPVTVTTGLGLDNGLDMTREVPADTDTDALVQILGDHADAIERVLGP